MYVSVITIIPDYEVPDVTLFGAPIVVASMPASVLADRRNVSRSQMRVLRGISLSSLAVSIALATLAAAHHYGVLALATVDGIIGFADHGSCGAF